MLSPLTILDIVLGCLAVVLLKQLMERKSSRGPFPPGPRPLPIIGNLLDMPTSHEWLTFMKWGEIYGDIMSTTVLGHRTVILNSSEAALDLLEKKGAAYSDRPNLVVASEMLRWNQVMGLTRYDAHFRGMRRLLHQTIGGRNQMQKYTRIVEEENRRFLRRTLRHPQNVVDHIRKAAGAIILNIAYGYRVEEEQDALVDLVDRAMRIFSEAAAPGAFLVDFIPSLRYVPSWFPGTGWMKKVNEWRTDAWDMIQVPYDIAKTLNSNGNATFPSLLSENPEYMKTSEREHILKYAAASLYSGGSDTTVSAIYSFILAMTLYPDVQKKAQAEVDAVIGQGRLPTLDDRDNLPYISALCSEVLRWLPVGPLGIVHRSMEDDVYNGYFFPKNTLFIANIWKFLHDPETYSDPMTFRPERFLPGDGRTPEPDPRTFVFGFGRRICPGRFLAETSIFISCATTLAAFNITKAVIDGKEITPPVETTSGIISHPKPFECSIKPRSAQAEALILSAEEH